MMSHLVTRVIQVYYRQQLDGKSKTYGEILIISHLTLEMAVKLGPLDVDL